MVHKLRQFIGGDNGAKRSQFKEEFLSLLFISELMTYLAKQHKQLHYMKPPVDVFGVDVVLYCEGTSKWIQLKAKDCDGGTSDWDVHRSLIRQPDGEIVLILVDYVDDDAISLQCRLFDKNKANDALSNKARFRKDENNTFCAVTIGMFLRPMRIDALCGQLFAR